MKTLPYSIRRAAPHVAGAALLSFLVAGSAAAQGTPWLAEPGTGSVSVTYVNQKSDAHYVKTERVDDPFDLALNTVFVGINYAVSDAISLDAQSAWASSFITDAKGPSGGQEGYSGLYDSNVAVTWRVVDELVSDAPSVALRLGVGVPGGYDTGYINALGDGAPGVEGSVIVGRFLDAVGFSAEAGFRYRGSTAVNSDAIGAASNAADVDVPNEMFANVGIFVPVGGRATVGGHYQMVNAMDGLELGGEGFSPSRFPGVHEDRHILGGRAIVDLTDLVSLSASYGQVVAGRNTAISRVLTVGVTYAFGGGSFGF